MFRYEICSSQDPWQKYVRSDQACFEGGLNAIIQEARLRENEDFCDQIWQAKKVIPCFLANVSNLDMACLYRDEHTLSMQLPFQKSQGRGISHWKIVPSNVATAHIRTTLTTALPRRDFLDEPRREINNVMESFERQRLMMHSKDPTHRFWTQNNQPQWTQQTRGLTNLHYQVKIMIWYIVPMFPIARRDR